MKMSVIRRFRSKHAVLLGLLTTVLIGGHAVAEAAKPDLPSQTKATRPTMTAPTATDYCVISQNGAYYAWKRGPGGVIQVSNDLADVCA